jgi:hypothetical protein
VAVAPSASSYGCRGAVDNGGAGAAAGVPSGDLVANDRGLSQPFAAWGEKVGISVQAARAEVASRIIRARRMVLLLPDPAASPEAQQQFLFGS